MAPPNYYYYFLGPAMAAVLLLVLNAVAIAGNGGRKDEEGEVRAAADKHVQGGGEGEEDCSVCLSQFADGQGVRLLPHCRHTFHATCIDKWLISHRSCPICRADPFRPEKHKSSANFGAHLSAAFSTNMNSTDFSPPSDC